MTTTNTVTVAPESSPHSSLACDSEEQKINGTVTSSSTVQSSSTGGELQQSSVNIQEDIDAVNSTESEAAKIVIAEDVVVDKNSLQPTSSTTSCSLLEGTTIATDVM